MAQQELQLPRVIFNGIFTLAEFIEEIEDIKNSQVFCVKIIKFFLLKMSKINIVF